MVNLDILKPYLMPLDERTKRFYVNEVLSVGLDNVIEYFKNVLVCRNNGDGMRLMQTISFLYRTDISEYIHVIETYVEKEEDKDELYNDLIQLHLNNLEFEKLNPPIPFKGKVKVRTEKEPKAPKEKKEKGPSALEKKLAAKAAKLSNLTFKIS